MAQPAINYLNVDSIAQTEGKYDAVKGTPWESLGHKIPAGASVSEMLVAARLDWEVLRCDTRIVATLPDGGKVNMPNPKSFALLRGDDHSILSPHIGPRYKVIQNDVAFGVFSEFVEAGQMTMETAGSFNNGRHIWGLAKTGHGFELANGDRYESYFLLLQSHEYGYALKAMWTPIRYPGGHTLVHNINKKGIDVNTTFSMSHARKFDDKRIQEIKEVVGIAAAAMDDFRGKAEFMHRMSISPRDGINYLIQVFDKTLSERCRLNGEDMPTTFAEMASHPVANRNLKKVAKMLDRTYRDGENNAWGCWSTVNQAFDHEMGHGDNTRLESIWLGKNKDAKLKAFNLAEALASAKGV